MKRFGFLAALGAVAAAPALPAPLAAVAKSTTPKMLVMAPGMEKIAQEVMESPFCAYGKYYYRITYCAPAGAALTDLTVTIDGNPIHAERHEA